MKYEESTTHKLRAALRFLEHLQLEIQLADKIEELKDKAILTKFQEVIQTLNEELNI